MHLFGLLNLNKPSGITSRRVVDRVQRLVKPAKVGHAGTLDPLACGVLVIGVGQATRLVEYVQERPKRYRGTFLLGRSSTTEDIEGEITELPNAVPPTREALERAAAELTGEVDQRPPAFSAIKVGGRRAYDLARAGQQVDLAPRRVRIDRLQIVRYVYPELELEIECSGGTYVRSLGRDLAERAGTAAVMSALQRTAIGCFLLTDAVEPDALTKENLGMHLLSPRWPWRVDGRTGRIGGPAAAAGARTADSGGGGRVGDRCAAFNAADELVAILTRQPDGEYRAVKNLV